MRVEFYTVPDPASQAKSSNADADIKGWLLAAIGEESDGEKRRFLENAAALMEQMREELQVYRDAAQYDYTRPKSMQFRGWNMGRLSEALRRTEAALAPGARKTRA